MHTKIIDEKYEDISQDSLSDIPSPNSSINLTKIGFDSFGLNSDLTKSMVEHFAFHHPTEVQALAIPEIMKPFQSVLVGAGTGTGKTLAYLLPVLHHLKAEEESAILEFEKAKKDALIKVEQNQNQLILQNPKLIQHPLVNIRKIGRPRALVVVPSRDLVYQVAQIGRRIGGACNLRVAGITSNMKLRYIRDQLDEPVDLLVSTPGCLLHFIKQGTLSLSRTRYITIDEADSMFDSGFGEELSQIIGPAKQFMEKLNRPCQFIIVSATLPKTIIRVINNEFPDISKVVTTTLHRTLPGLRQFFVPLAGNSTKDILILDLLRRAVTVDKRILIFCNTRKRCEALQHHLHSKGFNAVYLTADMDAKERFLQLKKFQTPSDENQIIISTDLLSRGLDTVIVDHVICYDFPKTIVDYLHRVGRTARNGTIGRASSIVTQKDRKLADQIQHARRRQAVIGE